MESQTVFHTHKTAGGWTFESVMDDIPAPPEAIKERDKILANMLFNYYMKHGEGCETSESKR